MKKISVTLFLLAALFELSGLCGLWGQTPISTIVKEYQNSPALQFSCSVQEIYSAKTTKTLTDIAKECSQTGLKDLAQTIEAGAFSSKAGIGFIYVGPKNKNYIITNRHTVENGESLVVAFTDSKGVTTEYTDVSIVALNYDYDLAVLAFPPKVRPLKKGLSFTEEYSYDVEKFLSGEAFKIISDEDDFDDELDEDADDKDSGEASGQAMNDSALAENASDDEVMFALRFSVPEIEEIERFAQANTAPVESENPGDEVYENAIQFGEFIGSEKTEFDGIVPYVSKRLLEDSGKQIFFDVQKRCPYTDWNTITSIFNNVSAAEGLRYIAAWYAFTGYNRIDYGEKGQRGRSARKYIPVDIQPPDTKANTEDWDVVFNLPGKHTHAVTSWTFEYGRWRLLSFKIGGAEYSINSDDFNHIGFVSLYQPSSYVLSNGFEKPIFPSTSYYTQYADFEVRMLNWLSVDTTVKACSYESPVYHQNKPLVGGVFEYAELQAGAKFLMPVYLKYVILSPYASVKLGARFGGFSNSFYFDLTGNADAAIRSTWFIRRKGLTVFEDTGVKFSLDSVLRQNQEGKRFTPNLSMFFGLGVGFN